MKANPVSLRLSGVPGRFLVSIVATFALALVSCAFAETGAETHYYSIPLDKLPLAEGTDPSDSQYTQGFSSNRFLSPSAPHPEAAFPYVWMEGEGEGYVAPERWPERWGTLNRSDLRVAIAVPAGETVEGILFYPRTDAAKGMARLPFRMEAGSIEPAERESFLRVKSAHYDRLTNIAQIGKPWFQHHLAELEKETDYQRLRERTVRRRGENDLEQTFDLFSGGRAISENLALDDTLDIQTGDSKPTVPLADIRGITIEEYDWRNLLGEPPESLDPLAALVPADQHGLFFGGVSPLMTFLEEWQKNGLPLLSLLDPVSVPAGLVERYEHQLGTSAKRLAGLAQEGLIRSVAITGGDPFFATGTDVAVLLETADPEILLKRFEEGFRRIADRDTGVELTETANALVILNRDRSRSGYVTMLDNAVLLTNSPRQIERIRQVASSEEKAIADLDEYLYFRDRYPRNNDAETGFLLLTDDTIRRWCGPEWRIGASRRLRAAALLSDLNVRHMSELVAGNPFADIEDESPGWLGGLTWTPAGALSDRYNHNGFLTPISELKIENVSFVEARAYERWRARYEAEWQEFFDPIAISFALAEDNIGFDLTVMPLTASSQYRNLLELAGNLAITPESGDPRTDALFQIALAVDPASPPMRMLAGMGGMFGGDFGYNPLSWMNGTVSLYFDDGFFWNLLEGSDDLDAVLMRNFGAIPAGLHIDSMDSTRLAFFLTGLRTMIEQSAPGMVRWETREHQSHSYVAIVSTDTVPAVGPVPTAVYYLTRSDALVISLNEDVIRSSIERYETSKTDASGPATQWLGKHLNLQLWQKGLRVLQAILHDDYQAHLHHLAQAPVPLLNDWKRRFPESDPVQLLQTIWRIEPVCPLGGEYVWNDEYKTYQSSRMGNAGSQRSLEIFPTALQELNSLRFGVDFENDGIRARGELIRNQDDSLTEKPIDANSEADAIETAAYFPLRENATWTWRETDSEFGDVIRITETVAEKKTDGDRKLVLVEGVFLADGEEMRYKTWLSDNEGIRLHRTVSDEFEEIYNPPHVELPARMVPGRPYRFESVTKFMADGESFESRTESKLILDGFETVEVEAGRFEDCLKLRSQSITSEEGSSILSSGTSWFAPGVGLVKSQWTGEWGQIRNELIYYEVPEN